MNDQELKKDVDKQLADFIVMTLLVEIGRNTDISPENKNLLNNLCNFLNFNRERLSDLQKLAFEGDIQTQNKNNVPNFEMFFSQIHERITHQFDKQKADNITLKIHGHMNCKEHYSTNQLKSLIFKTNYLRQESTIGNSENKISEFIQSTKDEEFRDLLVEVTEKDWAAELEQFRDKVIDLKVEESVGRDITLNQEKGLKKGAYVGGFLSAIVGLFIGKDLILLASLIAMIGISIVSVFLMGGVGAVVSAILGIIGVIFYSMVLMPLIASGNFLISKTVGIIACAAIGSIVGAGLGVKFLRYRLRQQQPELEKPYRAALDSYILMPNDLLRFWESRVEIYLRERKLRVQTRIREASKTRAECIKIIEELKSLKKDHDPTTENKLLYQASNMAKVIEDAQKVNAILQKLEDKFAAKIEELRVLVTRQEEFERDQYRLQEIQGKVRKVIGKSEEIRENWKEEKSSLQIQIQGMMNAFQNQLLHTKDFVQAEISLKQHTDSKIIKQLDNSL